VFCRIHVEDIAGACWHLIDHSSSHPNHQPSIVNVVDNEPTAPADLIRHGVSLLGCALPQEEHYDDICSEMSPMARSFWSENRRVSNQLLCRDLNYSLLYPTFREGLQDCLEQDKLNISSPDP
jgi:nucleoside-diphosphate-sugar epimerase